MKVPSELTIERTAAGLPSGIWEYHRESFGLVAEDHSGVHAPYCWNVYDGEWRVLLGRAHERHGPHIEDAIEELRASEARR
jgi:hypothetical protein